MLLITLYTNCYPTVRIAVVYKIVFKSIDKPIQILYNGNITKREG